MSETAQPEAKPNERGVSTGSTRKGAYEVGRCRPPLHTRFKPGQSGHPQGRRKGRLNNETIVEQIMNHNYTVRHGKTVLQLPLFAANLLKQGLEGAGGNDRSARLFLNYAEKNGFLGDREDETALESTGPISLPVNKPRPGDWLLEAVDPNQVSREDIIELSRLAQIIDEGGDFTALSLPNFERLKGIINKGRGKDITSQ
jgi:Family of unknown function (DUF5681)